MDDRGMLDSSDVISDLGKFTNWTYTVRHYTINGEGGPIPHTFVRLDSPDGSAWYEFGLAAENKGHVVDYSRIFQEPDQHHWTSQETPRVLTAADSERFINHLNQSILDTTSHEILNNSVAPAKAGGLGGADDRMRMITTYLYHDIPRRPPSRGLY